jgi:V/A-type H+/Na+-transporting ATPase subunit D
VAVALSKSSLQQQRERLRLLKRFLPALELKREQLTAKHKEAIAALAEAERAASQAGKSLSALLPLLGASATRLSGLVRVRRVELADEDVLGLRLPTLRAVEFEVAPYSFLASPPWLDDAVACIQETATQRLRARVQRARVDRMKGAVLRVSQRVNLFDKVLIPAAHQNIARIRVFLSDVERSAVVTSKIAKGKRARGREPAAAAGGER